MKLLKKSTFYFGTTKSTYKHIAKNGFESIYSNSRNYDAWLGDIGVYLLLNRPFVANHFARQKAYQELNEQPIILEAKLDTSNLTTEQVLDLTSDTGMYNFWESYIKLNKKLTGNNYLGVSNQNVSQKNSNTYFQSLSNNQMNYEVMNLDCIAVTELIVDKNIKIVIGLFQEGDSFAKSITGKSVKKYDNISAYKGILSRDHLEICVVNPKLVSLKKILKKSDLISHIKSGTKVSKKKYLDFINSSIGKKKDSI